MGRRVPLVRHQEADPPSQNDRRKGVGPSGAKNTGTLAELIRGLSSGIISSKAQAK